MQELSHYINRNKNHYPEREFQQYYYYREGYGLKERIEMIKKFYLTNDCLALCIIHKLYKYDEERQFIIDLLFKSNQSSALLPLIKDNLLTVEERIKAIEKIKNTEYLVQEWFINTDYYNATEEDKEYILSVTPDMRNHHDCYMLLMHSRFIGEKMRKEAFQSILDRGILYYLRKVLTAPHVHNPAWVPNEEEKEIIKKRIEELIEGSQVFALKQIINGSKQIRKKYRELVNDNDAMYNSLYCVKHGRKTLCFPTWWVNRAGTGCYVNIRIKNGQIIEVTQL